MCNPLQLQSSKGHICFGGIKGQQGLVWAKIDQMEGTVTFTKRKEVNETLNDWSGNIGKLVDKLEKVTFLVNKEFQNYKIPTEA